MLINGQPLDVTNFNMHALLDQLSSEVSATTHALYHSRLSWAS